MASFTCSVPLQHQLFVEIALSLLKQFVSRVLKLLRGLALTDFDSDSDR